MHTGLHWQVAVMQTPGKSGSSGLVPSSQVNPGLHLIAAHKPDMKVRAATNKHQRIRPLRNEGPNE